MISSFRNLLIPILSLCSLILALISQHLFGMEPCAWCVFQRLIFMFIFVFSLIGLIKIYVRVSSILVFFTSISGISVATYHFFIANNSTDCAISFAEKFMQFTKLNIILPQVFESYALCSESNVKILGVPYVILSMIMFILIAFFAFFAYVGSKKIDI